MKINHTLLTMFVAAAFAVSSVTSYAKTIQVDGNIINIAVYNKIFSPNSDGVADDLIFLFTKIDDKIKIKKWKLDIANESTGEVVFSISGKDSLPKQIKWNGMTDRTNALALETVYKYVFTATTSKSKFKSEGTGIRIDITPPFVSLNSSAETAIISDKDVFVKPVNFNISMGDESEIDTSKSKLQIINFNNKVVKEWVFDTFDSIPANIIWDGKDDIYDKEVPAGEYQAVLTATDVINNSESITKSLVVLEPVKGDVANIQIKEEERGLVVNLSSNILFSAGSSKLKKAAKDSLSETISILNAYPANKVLIEGHTDSVGKNSENLKLSHARAISVYNYFVKNGISADRLQAIGYGKDKPLISNKTEKGRKANRRVTIIILKKEDKDIDEHLSSNKTESLHK